MKPETELKLRAMLKRHEGYRIAVYKDSVGVLTAGYGHALQGPMAVAYRVGQTIPPSIIGAWFEEDYAEAKEQYNQLDLDLDDVRQAVMVDMLFNMGLGSAKSGKGVLGFVNTLAAIRAGDYVRAAKMMLQSRWARQVKGRADELAAMMRTGEWQK